MPMQSLIEACGIFGAIVAAACAIAAIVANMLRQGDEEAGEADDDG